MPEVVDVVPKGIADGGIRGGSLDVTEVEGAVVVVVFSDHTGRNDVEVVDNFWERGRDVEIPIGSSISNDETLKRQSLGVLVNLD